MNGLKIEPKYTSGMKDVYASFRWEQRSVVLRDASGRLLFEQHGVEVPSAWSQTATEILAHKYFRRSGVPLQAGASGGEYSARQVVHRLAACWRENGQRYGYFKSADDADVFYRECVFMLLSQMAAPNSPQWFNSGLFQEYGISGAPQGHYYVDPLDGLLKQSDSAYGRPQPHACFILSVKDDLVNPGGIMDLLLREARLFKYGSGTGTNFSALRGKDEVLSGGGRSSGLLSFLKIGDRAAGAIKSGGTTRRAAKMVCVDDDHPEIIDFVRWKKAEELKARVLIEAGYPADFEGEAYSTVSGQNANHSVRVSDAFMHAVEQEGSWALHRRTDGEVSDVIPARKLWDEILSATWSCGDPGLQFDTTINAWHTCPAGGRIKASNPCSEYMFLDDTACNLASLNLVAFYDEHSGEFDVEAFKHACRIWTIVLEISVAMAQFPSAEVARNSFEYRTLGLGFTNLGGLLMRMGLPYDHPKSRALAACITALMTGTAYLTSAQMARELGAFARYAENKLSMKQVLLQHVACLGASASSEVVHAPFIIDRAECPQMLINTTELVWQQVLHAADGSGFRNAQVSAIAPTGTIGLLMDADTLGIEPEFSLVRIKKLSGGGSMRIVNRSVEGALRLLGYPQEELQLILSALTGEIDGSVDQKGREDSSAATIPYLREEHKAVFATASGDPATSWGIAVSGHIAMMAAVQPFLSGSISKTVNLPNSATEADVSAAYFMAWKSGLKAVSIYRDGCKSDQPLKGRVDIIREIPETPRCPDCGFHTIRIESCFRCPNCGSTLACS